MIAVAAYMLVGLCILWLAFNSSTMSRKLMNETLQNDGVTIFVFQTLCTAALWPLIVVCALIAVCQQKRS